MRRIARLAAAVVFTAGLTTAGTAHACSCAPAAEEDAFARADHVFQGRVLARSDEPGQMMVRYRMVVSRERKGHVPRYVSVITATSSASCGAKLVVGKDYLVFATGDASDRKVETGLCNGTRQVSSGKPACGG
jgi:hypothetical protein